MAASMWEVTRLILGAPGTDPATIAQAHGFSTAELADALPFVLDNVSVDWSAAGVLPGAPPGSAELAASFLSELGASVQSQPGAVDLVAYDSFGTPGFDPDSFDPGLDPDFDDPGPALDTVPAPELLDPVPPSTFGQGGAGEAGGTDGSGDGPAGPDEPGAESPFDLFTTDVEDVPGAPVADLGGDHHGADDADVDLPDHDVEFD